MLNCDLSSQKSGDTSHRKEAFQLNAGNLLGSFSAERRAQAIE